MASSKKENSIAITIIGAIASIGVAWITSRPVARQAATNEVRERTSEIAELRTQVDELQKKLQAARPTAFGVPSFMQFNRPNVALSDGIVTAYVVVSYEPQTVIIYGRCGESETKMETRAITHVRVSQNETNSGSVFFPVRKGETWKIEVAGAKDYKSQGAYFIPFTH